MERWAWLVDRAPGWGLPPWHSPSCHSQTQVWDKTGWNGYSPDAFVEAEKLLVRQPLALEDGDHRVMDAAGGERHAVSRGPASPPRLPFCPPSAPQPSCSAGGTERAWSEAEHLSFLLEGRPWRAGTHRTCGTLSTPELFPRSWAPSLP